jgi:hypothetical protein
LSEDPEW